MKKFLLVTLSVMFLGIANVNAEVELPKVEDGEKVTVYMFRGTGCSACEAAIEELNSYAGKYDDYFELVTFDIWGQNPDQDNSDLLDYFIQMFQGDNTIPFFVVGDSFSQNGFSEAVIEAAMSEYVNEDYVDVVAEQMKGMEDKYTPSDLEQACIDEGITYIAPGEEVPVQYDVFIVVGIFVVVIGGILFLVLTPQKKSKK